MITLPSRYDGAPLRLAGLDKVLAGELERCLDCFRPAADKIDVPDAVWRVRNEFVGQLFGGLSRKEACMRIGEPIKLEMHCREHVGM